MDARAIPPAALRDVNAVELARVCIAERGLHCSLKFGLYAADGVARETSAWGVILADVAGHVTDALSGEGMGAKADLLDAIVERFNKKSPRRPPNAWAGLVPRPASPWRRAGLSPRLADSVHGRGGGAPGARDRPSGLVREVENAGIGDGLRPLIAGLVV